MQKNIFIIFYFILLLEGCSSTTNKPYVDTAVQQSSIGLGVGAVLSATGVGIMPGLLTGSVFGLIIGHNMQINESQYLQMVDKLNSHKVQIIQQGDEIKFILAAQNFFYYGSPNLFARQKHTFTLLTELINKLPASTVRVVGFSDNLGSRERNSSLSYARAKVVIKELNDNKLDTRLVWAVNGEELLPVVQESELADFENSSNRIEITLNPIEHLGIG